MKNRRTTTCGYARGDDTRARVVASALRLFGQHGFDGASTRDIAVDAGVSAPALQYYFDSKEGLYLACVEHMVERAWFHLDDAAKNAEALLARRAAPTALIEAYCDIQAGMADFIFSSQEPFDWLLIVVREQAGLGPDAGFQMMYEKFNARLLKLNCRLVGRLLHRPATAKDILVRAMSLNGQLLVFLFGHRTVLKALAWDDFTTDQVDLIKRIIRENTRGLLNVMQCAARTGPSPPGRTASPSG